MRILLLLLTVVLLSCSDKKEAAKTAWKQPQITWKKRPTTHMAGLPLTYTLESNSTTGGMALAISNDYGNALVIAKKQGKNYRFEVPAIFANNCGFLNYALIQDGHTLYQGKTNIAANSTTHLLETYCGPPYLVASRDDFSMLVVIPQDFYDNPNKAPYMSAELYQNRPRERLITHEELLGHNNIYSRTIKGKVFVRAYIDTLQSKLLELSILSNNPTNFTISYTRQSVFSDAKELTTYTTSVIRDQFGNIVENGTLVSFYLSSSNGTHRKAFAKTSNGVAYTHVIHPSEPVTYSVKAYVENFAESNTVKLSYKQAEDKWKKSEDEREEP